MVQSWLHFFSQDPLLISGVSLLTCIVQITGDIPFCHQHCQNFDTIIKSWRQAIFFFDFPMYEILCPFLYAGISQFFLRSSLSVSKGFSSVPAQVLLNLCVMHFTYTSALLRLIKTRWNKEGVMTGILVQPVTGFCCPKIEVIILHTSGLWNWFSLIVVLKETGLFCRPQHPDK